MDTLNTPQQRLVRVLLAEPCGTWLTIADAWKRAKMNMRKGETSVWLDELEWRSIIGCKRGPRVRGKRKPRRTHLTLLRVPGGTSPQWQRGLDWGY